MIKLRYLILFLLIAFGSCSKDDSIEQEERVDRNANLQPLGTSARDFLTADNFTGIQLEVGYVQGFRPSEDSVEELVAFLKERCYKPADISIKYTVVPATSDEPVDIDEIVAIESENRTVYNQGDALGVWVFFSGNNSVRDEGRSFILGSAYRNTSCVVYQKTLQELSADITGSSISRIESTTLQHEFGHLFGLVDLGTPMQVDHQDTSANDDGTTAPNQHCNVPGCLMYFQTVTDIFSLALGSGAVADLDELCINDLQANGGK